MTTVLLNTGFLINRPSGSLINAGVSYSSLQETPLWHDVNDVIDHILQWPLLHVRADLSVCNWKYILKHAPYSD